MRKTIFIYSKNIFLDFLLQVENEVYSTLPMHNAVFYHDLM